MAHGTLDTKDEMLSSLDATKHGDRKLDKFLTSRTKKKKRPLSGATGTAACALRFAFVIPKAAFANVALMPGEAMPIALRCPIPSNLALRESIAITSALYLAGGKDVFGMQLPARGSTFVSLKFGKYAA